MSKENRVIIYDNSENTPTDLFTHEPHEIKTTFQNEYIEAIHRAYNQFYYESLITFRQLFQKKLPDQMIQEVDLRSQSNSFIKNKVTKLYDYLDTVFMNRQIGYFCGEEFKSLDKMGEYFFGNFTTFLTADEKKLPYWKEFVEVTKWYKDFNLSEIKKKNDLTIVELFKRSEDRLSLDMVRITKDIHIAVFCDAGIDHEKIVSGKDISPFANMLRYIYLVPELQNKVKFYKSNQEIEAPWKQQPEVWRTCAHIFNSGLVVDHDYVGKGIESGGKGNDSNKLGAKKDHFNTSMNKVLLHDKSIEPNQYPINGFGEICRLKKEREKVKISFSNEYCEAFLAALTKSLENMGGGVSGKPFASNSANGSNGNFDIQDLLLKYFTKEQKSYPYWNNFFQVIAYYEQFNLQQLSSYDIDKLPQLLKNSEWRISLDMVNLCQNERICFICEKNYDFDNCVIKGNTYSKLANAMRYVYHHPTLKEKVRFYDGENFFEAPWEKNQLAWGKCLKKFYSDLSISTLLYGHSSNGQKAQNQISKLIEEKKVEFELKPLIQPHYSSDKKQINEIRGRKLDVIVEEQENNTKKTGKTTNLKLYKSQKYRATR